MDHYAAIDVSLEWSSICIIDPSGRIVCEAKVSSEREAVVDFFRASGLTFARIGLEAGPLSQWLHAGLVEAGLPTICIETRHVKAALKAMTVKTDKNDARGMAQLMRLGWFRPVHVKTLMAQEIRALLTARRLLLAKLCDLETSLRGILRGFGLKVGTVSKRRFENRIRELVAGQTMLECVVAPVLRVHAALRGEYTILHRTLLAVVRDDQVCRRLMTVPGVGAVVAMTFKSAIDGPSASSAPKRSAPTSALRRASTSQARLIVRAGSAKSAMPRSAWCCTRRPTSCSPAQRAGPALRCGRYASPVARV
jgi:transposase